MATLKAKLPGLTTAVDKQGVTTIAAKIQKAASGGKPKPLATPLPIGTLVDAAFPQKGAHFSTNPQMDAKFKMLADNLEREAELPKGSWAMTLMKLSKALADEPEVITTLTREAKAQYFTAIKKWSTSSTAHGAAQSMSDDAAMKHADKLAAQADQLELDSSMADGMNWTI